MDRGKKGSKIHLITERTGLPLPIGVSGANLHDSQALKPPVRGIPPIRSRRGPCRRRFAKLHGDKGYDYDHLPRWLRRRGIRHRIARKGIESPTRLGRHRWTIERTMSWLAGCRRLHRRHERKADPSWPSPPSPALSSAAADSPNETTSKAADLADNFRKSSW